MGAAQLRRTSHRVSWHWLPPLFSSPLPLFFSSRPPLPFFAFPLLVSSYLRLLFSCAPPLQLFSLVPRASSFPQLLWSSFRLPLSFCQPPLFCASLPPVSSVPRFLFVMLHVWLRPARALSFPLPLFFWLPLASCAVLPLAFSFAPLLISFALLASCALLPVFYAHLLVSSSLPLPLASSCLLRVSAPPPAAFYLLPASSSSPPRLVSFSSLPPVSSSPLLASSSPRSSFSLPPIFPGPPTLSFYFRPPFSSFLPPPSEWARWAWVSRATSRTRSFHTCENVRGMPEKNVENRLKIWV